MAGDEAKHVGVRNAITNLLRVWPAFEQGMREASPRWIGDKFSEATDFVWALDRAFKRANDEETRKLAMRFSSDLKNALDHKTPPTMRSLTFTLGMLVEQGVQNGSMAPGNAAEFCRGLEAVFDRAFPQDGKPERVELPAGGSALVRSLDKGDEIKLAALSIRRRISAAISDNTPGEPVEDARVDRLVEVLGDLLAEISCNR